jgi:Mg2+-importing ATPase
MPVLMTTGAIIAVGMLLPFVSLGGKLGLVPLPAIYFAWLAVILASYSVLTQIVKGWYIRRFGSWL